MRDPATGQLRRATKSGATLGVLRDARGRIALATTAAGKRLVMRDAQGAILSEVEDGGAVTTHVHGASGRIGLATGTTAYAVSKDLRGSTRFLYGADGRPATWLAYLAGGLLDSGASSTNALAAKVRNRYTGQDWLEGAALYDYGARAYDPAIIRFLSPDPADETPSPYMYVGGNPVNAVDPDGAMKLPVGLYFLKIRNNLYGVLVTGNPTREYTIGAHVLGRKDMAGAYGLAFNLRMNSLNYAQMGPASPFNLPVLAHPINFVDLHGYIYATVFNARKISSKRFDVKSLMEITFADNPVGTKLKWRKFNEGEPYKDNTMKSLEDFDNFYWYENRKRLTPKNWHYAEIGDTQLWLYSPRPRPDLAPAAQPPIVAPAPVLALAPPAPVVPPPGGAVKQAPRGAHGDGPPAKYRRLNGPQDEI